MAGCPESEKKKEKQSIRTTEGESKERKAGNLQLGRRISIFLDYKEWRMGASPGSTICSGICFGCQVALIFHPIQVGGDFF